MRLHPHGRALHRHDHLHPRESERCASASLESGHLADQRRFAHVAWAATPRRNGRTDTEQFDVSDQRTLDEVVRWLMENGLYSLLLHGLLPRGAHGRPLHEPLQERADPELLPSQRADDAEGVFAGLCQRRHHARAGRNDDRAGTCSTSPIAKARSITAQKYLTEIEQGDAGLPFLRNRVAEDRAHHQRRLPHGRPQRYALGAERVHIAVFGRRNAGKSSVDQRAHRAEREPSSRPSAGATTDPGVARRWNCCPAGPVVMIGHARAGRRGRGRLGAERMRPRAARAGPRGRRRAGGGRGGGAWRPEDRALQQKRRGQKGLRACSPSYNKCDLRAVLAAAEGEIGRQRPHAARAWRRSRKRLGRARATAGRREEIAGRLAGGGRSRRAGGAHRRFRAQGAA